MLHSVTTKSSSFTILRATSLQSYVTHEGDPTKLCFLAQRSEVNSRTRHAVDIRYSKSFILRMERLLGHTWLSTGGESTTREFCQRLGLRPGHQVLDVGCGSGGSPFFMSRLYGVHVHGVDISSNMIDLAVQRQTHLRRALRKRVHFELRDILDADYDANSYDVIYSRNSIFHIEKKEELYAKIYRWLKPGGILFVTDYLAKSTPPSESCAEFSAKTCSTLVTISAYERVLAGAGFSVESRDLADDFCSIHQKELDAFLSTREAFLEEYSQVEFDEMVALATHKITLVKGGQITWASFFARK
ncbi:phosphomethylethanolamine N-methyltransferase-like [Penaeus monodon]|uniref:phosphomethylethanolamine N-methyltransferase-like n=1 Tax=Penaeus monodon TaxID=6687 RepID=UPI0018A770DB|nr:phosphomethylethanolamine N-methyltransferase-like [Penaeus monodon]